MIFPQQLLSGNISDLFIQGVKCSYNLYENYFLHRQIKNPENLSQLKTDLLASSWINGGFLCLELYSLYANWGARSFQPWGGSNVVVVAKGLVIASTVYVIGKNILSYARNFRSKMEKNDKLGPIKNSAKTSVQYYYEQNVAHLIYIARSLINLALPFFSQNPWVSLWSAASQSYNLYTSSRFSWIRCDLTLERPIGKWKEEQIEAYITDWLQKNEEQISEDATRFSEENLVSIELAKVLVVAARRQELNLNLRLQFGQQDAEISKVRYVYDSVMLKGGGKEECPVCQDPADIHSCTNNHFICESCLQQHILASSDKFIDFRNLTVTSHYQRFFNFGEGTYSHSTCDLQVPFEKLATCPQCRGRPLDDDLQAQIRLKHSKGGSEEDPKTTSTIIPVRDPNFHRNSFLTLLNGLLVSYRVLQSALRLLQDRYPEFSYKILEFQQDCVFLEVVSCCMDLFQHVYVQEKEKTRDGKWLYKVISLGICTGAAVIALSIFRQRNPALLATLQQLMTTPSGKDLKISPTIPALQMFMQWLHLTSAAINAHLTVIHSPNRALHLTSAFLQMFRGLGISRLTWISVEHSFQKTMFSKSSLMTGSKDVRCDVSGIARYDFFLPSLPSSEVFEQLTSYVKNALDDIKSWSAWTRGYFNVVPHKFSVNILPPSFKDLASKALPVLVDVFGYQGMISPSTPVELKIKLI